MTEIALTPAGPETLAAAAEPGAAPLRQGDISYASLWVPDVARAAAFYGAVLRLDYRPGHGQRLRGPVPDSGYGHWPIFHRSAEARFCDRGS